MSFYSMLFKENPDCDSILEVLGKSRDSFVRFRDIYISKGYIVVYTRCGGGNREYCESMYDEMSNHPWYSHNKDFEYDTTYSEIYFKLPEDSSIETLLNILNQGTNPRDSWNAFFGTVKKFAK